MRFGSAHVPRAINRVIFLARELFVNNRWKPCFEHGLEGFLEIGVLTAGAHLSVSHRPVPCSLKVSGDAPFAVPSGHEVEGFHKANLHWIFAVSRRQAQFQAHRIFLEKA